MKSTYTPFTPRVHNPVTQHQSACTTDEIPAAKFFNDIGARVTAVGANESHSKVRAESRLLSLLLRLREREWLRVCHYGGRANWAGGVETAGRVAVVLISGREGTSPTTESVDNVVADKASTGMRAKGRKRGFRELNDAEGTSWSATKRRKNDLAAHKHCYG